MKILVAFSLFLAQMFAGVHANTCDSIHPPSDQWVRGMANDSKFIFYGTITSVVDRGGSIEEVGFKIDRQLKADSAAQRFHETGDPVTPLKPTRRGSSLSATTTSFLAAQTTSTTSRTEACKPRSVATWKAPNNSFKPSPLRGLGRAP